MPDLKSIIEDLRSAPERIERASRVAITATGNELRNRLYSNSPVKTGRFQQGWRLGRAKSTSEETASLTITNSVPYADVLDSGIDPSNKKHTWVIGIENTGRKAKDIVKAKGIEPKATRIWSRSAVGGVSARVISKNTVRGLARNVANSIITAIGKK